MTAADTGGTPPVPPARQRTTRRPRFTGRAAVLVLVLAVLTVSYASSLRAGAPVLICPQSVATARSAIVVSSVSPERWLIMQR